MTDQQADTHEQPRLRRWPAYARFASVAAGAVADLSYLLRRVQRRNTGAPAGGEKDRRHSPGPPGLS